MIERTNGNGRNEQGGNPQAEFKARRDEMSQLFRYHAQEMIRIAGIASQTADSEQVASFLPELNTHLIMGAQLAIDALWVDTMNDHGIPAETIVALWDKKEQLRRDAQNAARQKREEES
jgi:hypothetical protein